MSVIAVSPKIISKLNPDSLLGYLEFHTIPDLRIHKGDLTNLWSKHGLPNEFLPGEIRSCDAYRRATASVQQNIAVNWQGSQYTTRIMVREVKSDTKEIVRLLVREVVDTQNEVLDYAAVGKMLFNREKEYISTHCEFGYSSEFNYHKILERAADTFNDYVYYHTRDTIRNILGRVIRSTNPIRIIPRSQGKFIPKRSNHLLTGLQGLLQDLTTYANYNECRMDLIPIVDTIEQRALVARRANEELHDELDDLVADLAGHLKSKDKGINIKTVQHMANKARDIQQRAQEYEEMLEVKLSLLRTQITEFIGKTKIITEPRLPQENIC